MGIGGGESASGNALHSVPGIFYEVASSRQESAAGHVRRRLGLGNSKVLFVCL